jgi:K+-transporting ATPase ATPase B chain
LLDKTGTVTHGNRQAVAFIPAQGIAPAELVEASLQASMADNTPEGRSIMALAKKLYGITPEKQDGERVVIPFSAETRVSGVTIGERALLKGADDVISAYVGKLGGFVPPDITQQVEKIARQGGTPLMVAEGPRILGLIHLKDVIKSNLKDRLAALRKMGIRSVMITGDNPLTAAALASEAGVDDFIAQASPEAKLKYIRYMQSNGDVVAMVGDGSNDAPALAQANVALAMNNGTQAAKEAANMVDLDSDPTKLIEVVTIGKELLMTRGALTTFSFANDIAKYVSVMAAMFLSTYPSLHKLNVLGLSSPHNAVLATVLFNALIIAALVPIAIRGVSYRIGPAERLLRHNLLVYGLGGLLLPFASIKLIDWLLSLIGGF